MSKETADDGKISTLALGAEIIGEINASGSFRVVGKIKGNIKITGRLVVDDAGVIEGDVTCKIASISGKIDGRVVAEEMLELNKTARVHGDIVTTKIKIEEGAIFTGTCNMDSKDVLPSGNNGASFK